MTESIQKLFEAAACRLDTLCANANVARMGVAFVERRSQLSGPDAERPSTR
jgi:hypothetical protein